MASKNLYSKIKTISKIYNKTDPWMNNQTTKYALYNNTEGGELL